MRRFIIDDIYYIILVFENCKSKFTAGSMVKSNKFFKKNLWDKIIIIIIIIIIIT
jgi:predicted nuclease of restriction endonuclease-like (RecB) superfamily